MRCSKFKLAVMILLILYLAFSYLNNKTFASEDDLMFTEDELRFSATSNEQFQRLLAYWDGKYPSWFGGAYQDVKNKKFYILTTCEPSAVESQIWETADNSQIIIRRVDNSYDDLLTVKEKIEKRMLQGIKASSPIIPYFAAVGIDEINNQIYLRIVENELFVDSDFVDFLQIDNEVIRFEYTDDKASTQASVKSGYSNIVYASQGSTISFCANRVNSNGVTEHGFVTAGHACTKNNPAIYNNAYVGKVTECFAGGPVDAAFINMDAYPSSGYAQSTILSGSFNIIGASPVGIVGTVYEAHLGLSGVFYATVYSTSVIIPAYSVFYTDVIDMTQSYSQNGDSGSPLVFAPTNVGTFRYIVGTLIGEAGTNHRIYSKYFNIASALNCTLY